MKLSIKLFAKHSGRSINDVIMRPPTCTMGYRYLNVAFRCWVFLQLTISKKRLTKLLLHITRKNGYSFKMCFKISITKNRKKYFMLLVFDLISPGTLYRI